MLEKPGNEAHCQLRDGRQLSFHQFKTPPQSLQSRYKRVLVEFGDISSPPPPPLRAVRVCNPPPPRQTQHGLGVCICMHLVNGTGNSPSPGQPTLE